MFKFNIPIRKVDEEKRLVYGLVTEEIVDQSGEILDYETSKPYFEAWSEGISKATGGTSVGNLRLMHQPVVAGKLTSLQFDDEARQISCVAKVVDDAAWNLVLEGCLTGFSMGGSYVKRWKDKANKSVTRFTAKPVEVSVVDNPCVETATFEYIKADGSIELRKFHPIGDESMLTEAQIEERARELAKAAGTPDAYTGFMAEAQALLEGEIELQKAAASEEDEDKEDDEEAEKAAEDDEDKEDDEEEKPSEKSAPTEEDRLTAAQSLVQVWLAPDGSTHAKKSTAIEHVLGIDPVEESPVEKALREARGDAPADGGPATALAELDSSLEKTLRGLEAAQTVILPLTKGLYEVGEMASLLSRFRCLLSTEAWEAKYEGDGSPIPGRLLTILQDLGGVLIDMTQEEVAEMLVIAGADVAELVVSDVVVPVELSVLVEMTKANEPVMQKVGARNSRSDQSTIQATHDNAVLLGATCDCTSTKSADGDDLAKIEDTDLVKGLRTENDRLSGEVEKAIGGISDLGAQITELRAELVALKNTPQPLPPRTDHVVLERMGRSITLDQAAIEKMTPEERADLAIRLSQSNPIQKMA